MHVIQPCIVAQLMTPFCYFQPKDGLPDSKGFLLSEIPSPGFHSSGPKSSRCRKTQMHYNVMEHAKIGK